MNKKAFLLTVLSLVMACSSKPNSFSGDSSTSSPSSSSSIDSNRMVRSMGLTSENLLTSYSDVRILKSYSHITKNHDETTYMSFSDYNSLTEYTETLKEDDGNYYRPTIEYFEGLNQELFADKNFIVAPEIMSNSGSYSYEFNNLYLKDGKLYIQLIFDDPDQKGYSVDAAIAWSVCTIFVSKNIQFTEVVNVIERI